MATRRDVTPECDVCGSTDGVRRYKIEFVDGGRHMTADLCNEHGRPLETLADLIPPKGRSARRDEIQPIEVYSESKVRQLRKEWRAQQKAPEK